MSKRNELLEKDIKKRIDQARGSISMKEKEHRSLFNIIIVILLTITVLVSLFRYIFY